MSPITVEDIGSDKYAEVVSQCVIPEGGTMAGDMVLLALAHDGEFYLIINEESVREDTAMGRDEAFAREGFAFSVAAMLSCGVPV